ncbi:MAG: hypothetical protein JNM09_05685 [Blastocatellia bacterium]|nr:hypothetical protein [Blastocatellia bacterium]
MKSLSLILFLTLGLAVVLSQDTSSKLIYADFEKLTKENRPISNREGQIIFSAMGENQANKPKIAPRMFGAQAPLTQRLGFTFELPQPNSWAEASMTIVGMKDKGRLDDWAKTLIVKAEDVSGYKSLSLDIGAAGATQIRLRLLSEGNGVDTGGAPPEHTLTITNELKPYKVSLTDFKQPSGDWVKKKVTTDQVLKKLTGIQISVTQIPSQGVLIVDNVAFEK